MKYAKIHGQKVRIIRQIGTLSYCRFETKNGSYKAWVNTDELTPTWSEVFIQFCKWCGVNRSAAIGILLFLRFGAMLGAGILLGNVLYNMLF